MGRGMPRPLVWKHLTGEFVLDRAHVMGVLNVTPDSFSDGRRFLDPDVAVLRGLEIAEEEADILDVGGGAHRPGAAPGFPGGPGLRDPAMMEMLARSGAGAIIMHMLGEPKTMQEAPEYADVVREVRSYLEGRVRAALAARIPREAIAVDPGIGFGKTADHNLELIRNLDRIAAPGTPASVGGS